MNHRHRKTLLLLAFCVVSMTFAHEPVAADDDLKLNHLLRGRVVDPDGNPVRGATVTTLSFDDIVKPITTTTGASGAFAMKVHASGAYGPSFNVTSEDGSLVSAVSQFSYTTDDRKPFKVVLGPWKETVVKVVDQDGKPVPDAEVSLQANYLGYQRKKTDQDGISTLRYPADLKVDLINALKADVGFDYYENYDAHPTQERLDVPDEIQLTLSGSMAVSVTVVDGQGKPIPNAYVAPWIIPLPNKITSANVGGVLYQRTGKDGVVKFAWLPQTLTQVTFLVNAKGYSSPKRTRFTGGEHDLTANLQENPVVTGKVTYADGTPAAGIELQGEGRGVGDYFRGYATTEEDGTYLMKIRPNQQTIIAITEERYAAASKTNINLAPGKKAVANFELSSGTLIRGSLTLGPDKAPLADETATLIQENGVANLVRWSQSDLDGDYFFRVGPGTYSLRLPGSAKMQLRVKNQKEIVKDAHLERKERDILQGNVLSQDGKPIANAEIRGETINDRNGHAGFNAKSKSDGSFRTERWTDQMVVFVISQETQAAAVTQIEPDDQNINFTLEPAATVEGMIVDANDKPVDGVRVQITMSTDDGSVYDFHQTDEEGKFEFTCPVGVACQFYAVHKDQHNEMGKLDVDAAKNYKLETHELESAQ